MFWREREKENKEQNGGTPCGQVRVLLVGDSGVGKSSLVHLIVKGSSITRPPQTIGCTVGVKHITYGNSGSSSNSIKGDSERDFFIELWDVSGHDRYKSCRSLFYSQINGVIFVHDLSQRRTRTSLQKWAAEIAAIGSFSAPLGSGGPGGLPVPYIVIGNKADIAAKEGTRGSSGNLVDAARQWVEKQGLLPSSEELPLTESFPGSGGLLAAAKEARYDKEAVMKFFRMLIRRRYFSDDLSTPNPWSTPVQRPLQRSSENLSDEDQLYKSTRLIGDPYKYNVLPPLPAQRNLTPPPTLYPQQPMSTPENYSLPRFAQEISSARSKRADINLIPLKLTRSTSPDHREYKSTKREGKRSLIIVKVMVEVWWSLLGAAIPAVVAGQAFRIKRRRAEEQRIKSARGREKTSDDIFVCERVCTSKRMLKKVGAFSKDPIPDTCVTVCGVSELDACSDACARAVCVNQHQVPNWNDICLRRCQSECLKLSASRSF
ncbi:hypothetical protein F0562_005688 [Nyssa sinensis]|uniref:Uncharacterized protein n=1 Tax=Nyssa sinensis TaxID=561372 RepID=A0A5J5AIP6_9ASTE|nr:hypothetical protein F0562_005688 [Nyssa sinensis]